ncbi:hypothetical protein [Streptomyces griseus]|uniref:hypothetical protein n=1 Tax=Streptomyces griseus TaxID=1911 RepID=UPI0005625A76|nr:hypothetical protein [Streptomyces griseus]
MSEWPPGPEPEPDGTQAAGWPAPIEGCADERGVPAPGPEAAVAGRSGTEMHCVFPIYVVLAGDGGREGGDDIAATIWDALYQALS